MSLLIAALVVTALGPRPPVLTGGDPAAYVRRLGEFSDSLADQAQGAPCPARTAASVSGLALDPAGLQREGINMAGVAAAWEEAVDVSGCGRRVRVKMFVARRGEGWGVLALPPGEGQVAYTLYKDVRTPAAIAAVDHGPPLSCSREEAARTMRLADTALTTPYGPRRPWSERWTFVVCNQLRPVEIDFLPTPDGGTDYHIKTR